MSKLSRFKKKENGKKKIIIEIYVFLIIGICMVIGMTYAVYQKENEVTFINAKVRWPRADEITYTTTSNTSVKNVSEALNDLYGKLGE